RPRPLAVVDLREHPSEYCPNPSLHGGRGQVKDGYGTTRGDAACGQVEGGTPSRANPRLVRRQPQGWYSHYPACLMIANVGVFLSRRLRPAVHRQSMRCRGGCPGRQIELPQNVLDVSLDGVLGYVERGGDGTILRPRSD